MPFGRSRRLKELMIFSRARLPVWPVAALLFAGCSASAQEPDVGWDPRETGQLTLSWQTVLIGLLMALACGGIWKLLMWFLESRRSSINWPRARLLWPTAMLAWGLVILAMFAKIESGGWAADAITGVFAVVNFPALILAAGILELFRQPPGWFRILVGSSAVWGGNYLIVRLAEWRAWLNVSTSLHLVDRSK